MARNGATTQVEQRSGAPNVHMAGEAGLARPANVSRPSLYDRLDAAGPDSLTLITGPPGAGKTCLLRAWLEERPRPSPVVWLALERSDGRPGRFWTQLARLVAAASHGGSEPPFEAADNATDEFAAALEDLCEQHPEPVLVVLDDFEQLHSREVSESLDRFLRRPQGAVRFVIASRLDPDLSLQRLRLEGRLVELRADDLALTPDEAGALLALSGVELAREQVLALHARTEGWVGGLSLAALSLVDHPDPAGFVQSFGGDERTVADYLVEEVLHHQPAAIRDFLLRTSVLEILEPAVVDAVTGGTEGSQALERLERSNAFLVPLDEHRRRYRYHPMFQALLLSQLRYQMPDAHRLSHRRAARWYAARGAAPSAMRHAIAADDLTMARDLLGEHWLWFVVHGRGSELGEWMDALPPSLVAHDAGLALAAAGAALTRGEGEQVREYIAIADARAGDLPPKRRAHHALGRAVLAMCLARAAADYDGVRTAAHKVRATQQTTGERLAAQALTLVCLGAAEHWSNERGDGTRRLEDALALARRDGCEYVAFDALSQLALFRALGGSLRDGASFAEAALSTAAEHGWEDHPSTAPAQLALGISHLYWAEYDEALERIERAQAATKRSTIRTTRVLVALFDGLIVGLADVEEGIRLVRAANHDIDRWRLSDRLGALGGFFEATLLEDAGEPVHASDALERGEVRSVAPLEAAIIDARTALADGNPTEALRKLPREFVLHHPAHQQATRVEALALAAVARHRLHDDDRALDLLEQALARAQPQGYRQPLLSVGPSLRELLKRRIRAGTNHRALAGEIVELLDGRGEDAAGDSRLLLDPLSDREEAVLRYLPTGMSKAEIASELFVSVNTVKTHTKNIYRKLGASTRTEAVRRARHINLV